MQADKVAAGLLSLGMKRGDRIGIWGPNSYEWLLTQWAAARAGLILVITRITFEISKNNMLENILGEYKSGISSWRIAICARKSRC